MKRVSKSHISSTHLLVYLVPPSFCICMNMMLCELFMQFSTLTKFRDKPIFTLVSLPRVFMALDILPQFSRVAVIVFTWVTKRDQKLTSRGKNHITGPYHSKKICK